ncbi:uncharacterized protein LOC130448466 [Diorhabda sublineata]|uniref:uncharacterized protein LOC130448466 n=1 Tax=Diorhabda sublineata TaxID=1163346 RepID=UPI0024E11A06|nr:uncharacterized protein LOC130448466 [Diorhabda sublineata]
MSGGPGPPPVPGNHRSGTPVGWSPLHFRPTSPYAPSPPPRMSSPAANMFGTRLPYGMPCPRPRWPTALSPVPVPPPHAFSPPPPGPPPGPKPFRRPMHPPSPAPTRCASPLDSPYFKGIQPYSPDHFSGIQSYSPDHFRSGPQSYSTTPDYSFGPPNRDFEYVGVPLEPPPLPHNYDPEEDEESGPTTAEIIANQSQDYIDEKLAEYQATIYLLQGKHINLLLPRNDKVSLKRL